MDQKVYDLVIIGGGVAGLSAAINASSEGLKTVIVDGTKFGGQAGTSSLIENFIGFPEGLTGDELTRRSVMQAAKFNTEFICPFTVNRLAKIENLWNVTSDDEISLKTRSVLLAMGVSYRSLQTKGVSRFVGQGVSYGSPSLSENYNGKSLCVIGGANSAGQAAAYLAACDNCKVNLIIRAASIADKMSDYLIEKCRLHPNITIWESTEIMEARGKETLESIVVMAGNEVKEITCDRLFVLIGAKPKTSFLQGIVTLDQNGFIVTGSTMEAIADDPGNSGLFAAGDIRSGSVKRVAAAAGEGSRAINDIHAYLATQYHPVLKVN